MRLVLQRVNGAKVFVKQKVVGKISNGLLLFLGVGDSDNEDAADFLINKILKLKIFSSPGSNSFLDLSVQDVNGEILVISQFTLYGDCRKGTKPSFIGAARPEKAEQLYNYFVQKLKMSGLKVEAGIFGADMQVELVNDGPVTLVLDSK